MTFVTVPLSQALGHHCQAVEHYQVPASDPIHHIHYSAKVMDGAFATAGSVLSAGGAACMKFAHSLFKSAIRNSKIPS